MSKFWNFELGLPQFVFQLPHMTEGKVHVAKCGNIARQVARGCEILSNDSSASKGRL